MKFALTIVTFFLLLVFTFSCSHQQEELARNKTRGLADTVGFAHTATQMDSFMNRVTRLYKSSMPVSETGEENAVPAPWKLVISPHDDYTYAGDIYPQVLKNLSAPVIIMLGVAHKARQFGVENKLVFDSFAQWRGPYGPISPSPIRETIMSQLSDSSYIINDSLEEAEHSLEALLPFIQYYHRSFEIVPILVPYMSYERMQELSRELSAAITSISTEKQWKWGKDFAIAISNDCVHYGDEDWGGKNYAPFGADSAGYLMARAHELNIIEECLINQPEPERIRRFVDYTVQPDNFREYKWTWCGRYSVPFGLLTAWHLEDDLGTSPINGQLLQYSTSIVHPPIPVQDLGMGVTAPANIHHWVGYAAIGYK